METETVMLLVYGYINHIDIKSTSIADDLKKLICSFYPTIDSFDTTNKSDAMDTTQNNKIAIMCNPISGGRFAQIFGTYNVNKNEIYKCTLKLIKIYSSTFGIWDTDDVEASLQQGGKQRNNELFNAYGLAWNGYIYNRSNDGKKYANKRLKKGDIIEMYLDLINGQLSFKINQNDLGIAFANIDTSKSYKMFVAMYDQDEIQIITNKSNC
eukprot:143910_1